MFIARLCEREFAAAGWRRPIFNNHLMLIATLRTAGVFMAELRRREGKSRAETICRAHAVHLYRGVANRIFPWTRDPGGCAGDVNRRLIAVHSSGRGFTDDSKAIEDLPAEIIGAASPAVSGENFRRNLIWSGALTGAKQCTSQCTGPAALAQGEDIVFHTRI